MPNMFISPVYFFIKELKNEKNPLVHSYKIHELRRDDREYLLIELPPNVNPSLTENYILKETHFSIDKFYNTSKSQEHGFTPIHYTETYFSPTDDSEIVVHGYLNAKSEYQYAKVKNSPISLTSDQEKRLKDNIKLHQPFLDGLVREHTIRKQKAKQKSDLLEAKLSSLSRTLNEKNTQKQYIEIAREFLQAVNDFNEYSEIKDVRDKIVLTMFENIEIIKTFSQYESKQLSLAEIEAEVEIEVEIQADLCVLPKIQSINTLYKKALKNLFVTMKEFQKIPSSTAENLDLKIQLTNKINAYLLIIYSFPGKLLTSADLEKIEPIIFELNQYYTQQCNWLKERALEGNLLAMESFFPLLKKYITEDFYRSLMSPPQSKLIKIYDYLNENSIDYKNFIFKITEEQTYSLTKTIVLKSKNEYFQSLLFTLYIENKLSLFETLLRHGACPNGWGIKIKKQKIYEGYFTLFHCIAAHGDKDNNIYDYLSVLLTYKVNPHDVYTKNTQRFFNNEKLIISGKTNRKQLGKFRMMTNKVSDLNNNILMLALKSEIKGVELILNSASIADLVSCLAVLITKEEAFIRIPILALSYGIHFCDHDDMLSQRSDKKLFIAYEMYPCAQPSGVKFNFESCDMYKKYN